MYGNEKKRVASNIKMELRMPTTQFAYLRIWFGQQHKYVFRYQKWSLLLEEIIVTSNSHYKYT